MDILVPGSRLGLAPLCTPLVYLYVCTVMYVSLKFAHLSVHISYSLHTCEEMHTLELSIYVYSMYMHVYHVCNLG